MTDFVEFDEHLIQAVEIDKSPKTSIYHLLLTTFPNFQKTDQFYRDAFAQ